MMPRKSLLVSLLIATVFVGWRGAAWASCIAVYFVLTGRRSETLPDLLKLYRGMLGARWFLLVSNLLGTALALVIGWQLVMYRQVQFLSPIDVELVVNDRPGELQSLGFLRAKTPAAYRLRVGAHKIVYRETAATRFDGQIPLDVPPLFVDPSRVQVLVNYRKGLDYEKTE